VTYPSPLNDPAAQAQLLPLLLDKVTTTRDAELPGRVNVNTAPEAVLRTLPGLEESDIQNILAFRPNPAELADAVYQTPAWLVTEADIDPQTLRTLERYITARTQVYRAQVLGYFDGAPYTYAEMTDDVKAAWQKIHSDVSAASYPTLFDTFTQRGYELDHLSIVDWIEESIPGGMESKLGRLLDLAYTIEYGADSSEQSSLNLLYLLGYSGQGQFRVFGPSNEKYHVRGGNDQIPERLGQALAGQIATGSELVALRRTSAGRYELAFRQGSRTATVTADKVVLALPFSIVRRSVDVSQAGLSARKLQAIAEMGMGTNSKLHVQFTRRHWNDLGSNGETFADTGYQNTWEVSRAQAGRSGLLVDYTGGRIGDSFGSGTPATRAQRFLEQIEPVLPGLSRFWNGRATIDYWPGYEWTRGSYSYWKVGQYTAFAGIEGRREGDVHFCGEHTSVDFQGYLNGAVETGERAASEVLADLR